MPSKAPVRPRGLVSALGWYLVLLVVILAVASTAEAVTTGSVPSIRDLTRRAEVVVIGTVKSVHGYLDQSRQAVYTMVDLDAEQILKGTVTGPTVRLRELGGEANGVSTVVSDRATFAVGERVLVFLERDRDQQLRLVASFFGKYTLQFDPVAHAWTATRVAPGGRPVLDRIPLDKAKEVVVTP